MEVSSLQSEPVLIVDGLRFPESPRWHAGALWFSDMYAGRVCRWDPASNSVQEVVRIEDRPSGLGWLPDGRLLVVSMSERRILRLDRHGLATHADLGPFVSGDANDMVVGPDGRAYVGNFGRGYSEGRDPEPANLVIVEPDGAARHGPSGLLFPNGTVIAENATRLIIAEGFGKRLTEFSIAQDGDLTERHEFAALEDIPDGIALDKAGGIWIALPLSQQFVRVERTGNVTDRISVTPSGAFACTLGGAERRTLFVCVAAGSREQIRDGQSHGQILAVEVEHAGQGWP